MSCQEENAKCRRLFRTVSIGSGAIPAQPLLLQHFSRHCLSRYTTAIRCNMKPTPLFLSLLHENPGQKIFVHCRFGEDRTRVFIAAYRIAAERWPAEQAIKEMYFFGFNGLWHPSMKSFVEDFPSRLNSAPGLAALRAPPSQP